MIWRTKKENAISCSTYARSPHQVLCFFTMSCRKWVWTQLWSIQDFPDAKKKHFSHKKSNVHICCIIKAAMFVYESWSVPQCPGLLMFKITPLFSPCLCNLGLLQWYLHVMSRRSSMSLCHLRYCNSKKNNGISPLSSVHCPFSFFFPWYPHFKGPTWETVQNVKHSSFFFQPSQSKSWQKVPLQLFVLKVVLFTVKRIL